MHLLARSITWSWGPELLSTEPRHLCHQRDCGEACTPQRACVRAHLCVRVPVWAHARPCAHVPVPGKGLEDDLKCAFYQPSKLLQPKDGRAGTHGGQTVVDPEYEFSSFHSEPEMGGATGLPALAFPLVSSI